MKTGGPAVGRVAVVALLLTLAVAAGTGGHLVKFLGGASSREPAALERTISADAAALIARAHEGINGDQLLDYHTHILGLGTGETGTWVNPTLRNVWTPRHYFRFMVFASAAGIHDFQRADAEFVERLLSLVQSRPIPGRYQLAAFDYRYERDGAQNVSRSEFYVPNAYVFALADAYPAYFLPTMSIHPYRRDALEELSRWVARGGRMLKWLPSAMGIDPADPRIDPFYDALRTHDVVLLTHAGEEQAVEGDVDQQLGNPLRLRRALDRGVRVIVAHCAGLGEGEDLDNPEHPRVANFDLFMRLMDDPRYDGLLFGEISAMTQFNRVGRPLTRILERGDLHHRLVNGSNYPLPAVNIVIRTRSLARMGYITFRERDLLNEIFDYNPLLFDFVLKRIMHAPTTQARLPADVFHVNPRLQSADRPTAGTQGAQGVK